MRASTAVAVLNLALVVAAGSGYVAWDLRSTRPDAGSEGRSGPAPNGIERVWQVTGLVLAVVPEINVLVITHGDIPGYMPAMTMGFRAASPTIHEAVSVGDPVRFTLKGTPPNVVITAIEKME